MEEQGYIDVFRAIRGSPLFADAVWGYGAYKMVKVLRGETLGKVDAALGKVNIRRGVQDGFEKVLVDV